MADKRPKNEKWKKYGYRSSSETRSFSNVLFQMMGLPEFKADSNITMHQILRLIYLDQESPLSSLFFFDQWDKELTRETVARLLMGLYDEELSQAKLEKETVEKDMDTVSRKKKVAAEILEDPKVMSSLHLKGLIKKLEEEVVHISDRVQDDLRHSIATRDYFDAMHLDLCPVCLSELSKKEHGHCPVCDAPVDGSKGKNQAMRILLELDHQLTESEALLKGNKTELEDLKDKLRAKRRQLSAAQRVSRSLCMPATSR